MNFFKKITPLIIIIFTILLFFSKVIFTNDYGFQYDIKDIHYPWLYYSAKSLKSGNIPFWNPYYSSGEPHLANIQTSVFYPINLISYYVDNDEGITYKNIEINLIFHYFLGTIFFYFLLKKIYKINTIGSLVGSITYLFSGFNIAHTQHFSTIQSTTWIPIILLVYSYTKIDKISKILILAFLFSIQFLAGQTQIFFYTILFIGTYSLITSIIQKNIKPAKNILYILLPSLILTSLLVAFQLLPTLEYLNHVNRKNFSYTETLGSNLKLRNLFSYIIPYWTGGSKSEQTLFAFDFTENYYYSGILFPIIIIIGLINSKIRKKITNRTFIYCSIIFFVLSLGGSTPIHKFLFDYLPLYSKFKRTVNFYWFTNLSLICIFSEIISILLKEIKTIKLIHIFITFLILNSLILLYIIFSNNELIVIQNILEQFKYYIFFLPIIFIFIFFLNHNNNNNLKIILITFTILDFFVNNRNQVFNISKFKVDKYLNKNYIQDSSPTIPSLIDNTKHSNSANRILILPENWNGLVYTHACTIFDCNNTIGYYNMYLDHYSEYIDAMVGEKKFIQNLMNFGYGNAKFNNPSNNLIALLNINKFILGTNVFTKNKSHLDQISSGNNYTIVAEGGNRYSVLDTKTKYPYIFISDKIIKTSNYLESIEKIKNNENYSNEIYVSSHEPKLYFKIYSVDNLKVENYGINQIDLSADVSGNGILFLSEIFYPGWRVNVNGIEKNVLEVNGIFRGVEVESGYNNITFYYLPKLFYYGLSVSITSLLIMILICCFNRHHLHNIKSINSKN